MKKLTTPFLSTLIMMCLFSCKKELTQTEAIKEIKNLTSKKNVSKQSFEKNILPIVNELYLKDSVKFKMINYIAEKAKKETNKAVFKMQVKNLKEEMNFIK